MTKSIFNGVMLAVVRERSGLSQSDLARMTGLGQGYISELESGTKDNPRPGTVKKLTDALQVPVLALIHQVETD